MRTQPADPRGQGSGRLSIGLLAAFATGDGIPALTVAILLAGAGVLFLAAGTLGYGGALTRRRRPAPVVTPLLVFGDGPPSGHALRQSAHVSEHPPAGDSERRRRSRFARLPAFTRGPQAGARSAIPHSAQRRAVGYTTFPDRRRAVSPESRYQARRIRAACEARALVLHKLVGDVQSYPGPDLERPGLQHALQLLEAGEAGCLVVAGLDRLSRSAANLGMLIAQLEDIGVRLIVIDIELDTDTEEGRMAARTLIRVGALERREGEGSRAGAGRRSSSGGRPAVADLPLLQRRIATMRASGMTLQAIADTLNREGVPTLRGGAKWRPSSVQAATGYRRPSQREVEDDPEP